MIALFVFSFILLFLLLLHKRDLRLKACISTIFSFFSISEFPSKLSLSSFNENASGTGIIRLISDRCYYFLRILVLIEDLLMVPRSITMISGMFLKRRVPHFSPEIEKIFIGIFCHIQRLLLWVLFIVHQAKIVLLKQLLNILQRSTQTKYML